MDVEELKNRARSLELDGQLAEAITAYRQILSHLEQQGTVGTALPLYVKAGDLAIKTGDRKGGLGLYGRAARRYAEAGSARSVVALCTKIVHTSPANTYVYPRLARLMIERGHVNAAREVLVGYAAQTKQAKGREALERLAGRPDAQVKAILGKLLDAAEKRERVVAKRAAEPEPQSATPPEPEPEPEPSPPEPETAAPEPEPSQAEGETPAPVGFQEREPATETQPVTWDTSLDVEPESPEEDIEPAAVSEISPVEEPEPIVDPASAVEEPSAREFEPRPVDVQPPAVEAESPPVEPEPSAYVEPEPSADAEPEPDLPETTAEPEPSTAQPDFDAPAIELDAEPQFEPPRLTPMPKPEPEAAVWDPAGARDEAEQSPDWSPWPSPDAEPAAREVSAGGRMTDEPLIFAAQGPPKRSGKIWMIVGAAAVVVAGTGGLFATGVLGGNGGGGDTPTQPATPARPTVTPPTSDSAGMPLALVDSLSRDSATADSVTDSLATDSTALALLVGDSLTLGDTVPADTSDTTAIVAGLGDSAVGGAVLPDSGPAVSDTIATGGEIPPPVVAPTDTTPDAALAAIGLPAVIIEGLPILNVREVVSNGRPGVLVGQAHPSGEPISVVTVPLGADTVAVGVITLPGDTAVGTTRMGNFLVSVRGRVPADTLAALLRRLTVARSN